eukprot:m51a1_g6224 hypothetical protein (742) ;mRNA; r:229946-233959
MRLTALGDRRGRRGCPQDGLEVHEADAGQRDAGCGILLTDMPARAIPPAAPALTAGPASTTTGLADPAERRALCSPSPSRTLLAAGLGERVPASRGSLWLLWLLRAAGREALAQGAYAQLSCDYPAADADGLRALRDARAAYPATRLLVENALRGAAERGSPGAPVLSQLCALLLRSAWEWGRSRTSAWAQASASTAEAASSATSARRLAACGKDLRLLHPQCVSATLTQPWLPAPWLPPASGAGFAKPTDGPLWRRHRGTALTLAIDDGNAPAVRQLLAVCPLVAPAPAAGWPRGGSCTGASPMDLLFRACWHGNLGVVRALLDAGALQSARAGRTSVCGSCFFDARPIDAACEAGHAQVVRELLQREPTLLHAASWRDVAPGPEHISGTSITPPNDGPCDGDNICDDPLMPLVQASEEACRLPVCTYEMIAGPDGTHASDVSDVSDDDALALLLLGCDEMESAEVGGVQVGSWGEQFAMEVDGDDAADAPGDVTAGQRISDVDALALLGLASDAEDVRGNSCGSSTHDGILADEQLVSSPYPHRIDGRPDDDDCGPQPDTEQRCPLALCRCCRGMTPLCLAARAGSVDVARVLLEAGADANERSCDASGSFGHCPDGSGCAPPLVHACRRLQVGYDPVGLVALLLEHGADASARCRDGRTALECAVGSGMTRVVELLAPRAAAEDLRRALARASLFIVETEILFILRRAAARADCTSVHPGDGVGEGDNAEQSASKTGH